MKIASHRPRAGRRRNAIRRERDARHLRDGPYTLRAPIADLAFTNKAVIYDILFKASAETTITIAADKKRFASIMRHHRE